MLYVYKAAVISSWNPFYWLESSIHEFPSSIPTALQFLNVFLITSGPIV